MTKYLTCSNGIGIVAEVAVEDGPVRDDTLPSSAFDAEMRVQAERRREALSAAKLSPQAAALLPLMMSVARLQARLAQQERAR